MAWDWGWPDDQAEAIIQGLPTAVSLMSVSEWSLPLRRGGIENVVGEYSISAVGPGPRAARQIRPLMARQAYQGSVTVVTLLPPFLRTPVPGVDFTSGHQVQADHE